MAKMRENPHHRALLDLIVNAAGSPSGQSLPDSYLGNDHPRYTISMPALRNIAKTWMRGHNDLSAAQALDLVTACIEAPSSTEKIMGGILIDYTTPAQRTFSPAIFDQWLDHLVGWAEIDSLCTGDYVRSQLPAHWPAWKKLLLKLSKDDNINKRRASLVLFCSPIGHVRDASMGETAFKIIDRLKGEKSVLITKAISWVLRTMIRHYRKEVRTYLSENKTSLPAIAVRETGVKLKTGKKNPAV